MKKDYEAWIRFYMEFADKLHLVDRKELIEHIKKVYASIGMRLPTLERGGDAVDIDPFTIFGLFNKGITDANRINIIAGFAKEFRVKAAVPENFEGIPVLNNQSSTFYYFLGDRGEHDIDHLWDFFYAAMDYADDATETNRRRVALDGKSSCRAHINTETGESLMAFPSGQKGENNADYR